jgi:hypothetical protein
VSGNVLIRSWNHNVVYMKAVKTAHAPLLNGEAKLFAMAQPTLGADATGTVNITTNWPTGVDRDSATLVKNTKHITVDYTLAVPPNSAIEVQEVQGTIVVSDVSGRVKATSKRGDITLYHVTGLAQATSESGNLNFWGVTGDAFGKTVSGNFSYSGVRGDIQATTNSGAVTILVTPQAIAEVLYNTVSGSFHSNLIPTHSANEPDDPGYVGELRGPLAGPETPLRRFRLDTISGNVTLNSAP